MTIVSSGWGSMASMSVLKAVAQPWMSPIAKRRLGMAALLLPVIEPSDR
jgi:hypothetical protein